MTGRRYVRTWSILAPLCVSLFTGCASTLATENSDPYTADDVIAMVEEEFSSCKPQLICEETQIEKEKPFERRIYVLRDTANEFTFSCSAVVRRPELPRPGAERDTNAFFHYAEGYAAHLNAEIGHVAEEYGFRTATTEEAEALIHSGVKRKYLDREVSLFDEGDFIFVTDGARGADMAVVCKKLHALYRPNGDGTVLSALYGRKITFYYLPSNEKDLTRAVFVAFFTLKGPNDWAATLADNPGSSSSEKDVAALEQNLARYFGSCLRSAH
ncbi:hypothetical protein [uncultured Selenomonas sp.]|uniref:hypothetical protein n=1 Tax=uncultured Selenomonas sp. TaxID=159275 RepID=UPI0028E50C9E|nr:hypothetical protein [uncultured Selenomonas sp.]